LLLDNCSVEKFDGLQQNFHISFTGLRIFTYLVFTDKYQAMYQCIPGIFWLVAVFEYENWKETQYQFIQELIQTNKKQITHHMLKLWKEN